MTTNLSVSRVLEGVSEKAASIPAIDSPDHRTKDNTGEIINNLSPALSARTSRRALIMNSIVSAAALSSAVAVASPAPDLAVLPSTSDDENLVMLCAQLEGAWDSLGETCDLLGIAEEKIFEWERQNPRPTEAEFAQSSDVKKEGAFEKKVALEKLLALTEQFPKSTAEDRAAQLAYESARQTWRKRKAEAETLFGHDKASADELAANNEISRHADAICNTPARSVHGLIAKARAAAKTKDADIAWSVVDDLMASVA